jgi:LysM repeat protein
MRRIFFPFLFIFILFICLGGIPPKPVQAESINVYDLIGAVNSLRASRGLPALQINNALMNSAQSHSQYQANIKTVTHTGSGGTRPVDRARAWGYGSGSTPFISENIAGGMNLSLQTIIYNYWSDDLHMNTMVNGTYHDVGAGVAVADGWAYYTLDVGYTAGGSSLQTTPTTPTSLTPAGPFTPTVQLIVGVTTTTPQPDGSIIHVVQYGQTVETISKAYAISPKDLIALNKLNATNPIIYVGQKLTIRIALPPTVTPTMTSTIATATRTITVTFTPTEPLPTKTPTPTQTITPTPTTQGWLERFDSSLSDQKRTLGFILIGVCAFGLLMILAGSIHRGKK